MAAFVDWQGASQFIIDEEWLRREAPGLVLSQNSCSFCDPAADAVALVNIIYYVLLDATVNDTSVQD